MRSRLNNISSATQPLAVLYFFDSILTSATEDCLSDSGLNGSVNAN
jgi:hypothetical protein